MSVQTANRSAKAINRTMALVLAGGRGSRLKDLTARRSKPAVYFGGSFRIIDFTLSNCINSGIRKLGVITQYKSDSLLKHLQRGWSFMHSELNEFIDIFPAQQQIDEVNWYRGTADSVYQNLEIIKEYGMEYIIILAGDHVYKMDYSVMLQDHIKSGLKCTVGCIKVPVSTASALGVMKVNSDGKIIDFVEKPKNPPALENEPSMTLASMGIYVFNTHYLYELLENAANSEEESDHDFGRDIIPAVVKEGQAFAHQFETSCIYDEYMTEPYWKDVGTVDAFWKANLDMASITPQLNVYDKTWPIWSYREQYPPAKFVRVSDDKSAQDIHNAIVSAGSVITESIVVNSVLFFDVKVDVGCKINKSVIFPHCKIGANSRITNTIIDSGCIIPPDTVIGEDPIKDAERFYRSDNGVTLVTKAALKKLNAN